MVRFISELYLLLMLCVSELDLINSLFLTTNTNQENMCWNWRGKTNSYWSWRGKISTFL